MSSLIIEGGNKLNGEVVVSGSKNAALPILATAILNPNKVTFYNVPDIEDVRTTLLILKSLGCQIDRKCDKIAICSEKMRKTEIPNELMKKARSTVILAGALIGRYNKATFYIPGGCNIGKRPIDIHLEAFKELGIDVNYDKNKIECNAKKIHSNKIYLKIPSVGATENIILASIFVNGTTYIHNAAMEPEIKDLATCLNKMGAKIYGAGTNKIVIVGVKKLYSTSYRIMPDRIEAGTYLAAAAITKGKIKLVNVNVLDMMEVLYKFKQIGCKISFNNNEIKLEAGRKLKNTNIITNPYPGFPTDLQSIISAVLTKSEGRSIIIETIFENRFEYCKELKKMGAKIELLDKNKIKITGNSDLIGTEVESTDLRGDASIIVAALAAKGKTKINGTKNLERGYENIDQKLNNIGAKVKLVNNY